MIAFCGHCSPSQGPRKPVDLTKKRYLTHSIFWEGVHRCHPPVGLFLAMTENKKRPK
jgi:hypothetical protein